jgi:hypothetical protein
VERLRVEYDDGIRQLVVCASSSEDLSNHLTAFSYQRLQQGALDVERRTIIKEHWAQSGFANTDLDLQLKQHGIQKIVLVGLSPTVASSPPDASAWNWAITSRW